MTERMQSFRCLAGIALALVLAGGTAAHVAPQMEGGPTGISMAEQERVDKAASASLLGEFRSSTADFLWIKVDAYVHGGVAMRGVTPQEKESGTFDRVGSPEGRASGNRAHHGDETPVIPSAAHDWRGWYGNVEREVSPYQDMNHHTHKDPKEALPLFRLMTVSNPHFIAGYVVGAAMIAHDHTKVDEAIAFLLEGAKSNPNSIEIAEEIGELYSGRYKRQYEAGMPYLVHAIVLGRGRDRSTLTEDEDEAFENAYRWAVLNRREAGDFAIARKVALEGLKMYPEDVVCKEFLKEHPEQPGLHTEGRGTKGRNWGS